jgi:glycosyltransferase involved in cell wall biosynthesis
MEANAVGTVSNLAICLCTCHRPIMLASCLQSLGAQILPDSVGASLVVVDNDPAGARLTIAQFCAEAPFPVYYVPEPRRGIARARNAALEKAIALGANWIAVLDDEGVKPLLTSLPRLLLSLPIGLLELVISPLAVAFGRRRFKQFALRGGKRLARVAGVGSVLLGHLPQPYRTIHGA